MHKPKDSKYFATEADDDETWIWAGFVTPGKHEITVNDPLTGVFKETIFVDPRTKDLEISRIQEFSEISNYAKTDVFTNWTADT